MNDIEFCAHNKNGRFRDQRSYVERKFDDFVQRVVDVGGSFVGLYPHKKKANGNRENGDAERHATTLNYVSGSLRSTVSFTEVITIFPANGSKLVRDNFNFGDNPSTHDLLIIATIFDRKTALEERFGTNNGFKIYNNLWAIYHSYSHLKEHHNESIKQKGIQPVPMHTVYTSLDHIK